MRKIKRRKNYTKYVVIAMICTFSCMGIGYSYLQESLSIHMSLSKKKKIDITEYIVTSGDGLYEDQYETGRYVYRGSEPDNYIQFNHELWRIISKESDGTYKIIKDEALERNMQFDENFYRETGSTYCDDPHYGCNVYGMVSGVYSSPQYDNWPVHSGTVTKNSSLADYLNTTYYQSLDVAVQNLIQTHAFSIGGVFAFYSGTGVQDSIAYSIETEKEYQWNGHVGLVSVNDFLRASTNPSCTSISDQYDVGNAVASPLCNNNYLLDIIDDGRGYWTISPAFDSFYLSTTQVWAIINNYRGTGVGGASWPAAETLDVYPVVYLKADIEFASGSGTDTEPYVIF